MSDLTVPSVGTVTSQDYITRAQLKTYLGSSVVTADTDTLVDMAKTAASRAIDAYCDRRFYLDTTATARTYTPSRTDRIDVDDIGSVAGLVVKTDAAGDGTYETTWAASDYQLLPVNAPYETPEAQPWTQVAAIGRYTFSLPYARYTRADRVQITALWGWPAVPALVTQACLILAGRIFHRRNSPQGVAAFDDFGPVRLSRGMDGDVVLMLEDYRKDQLLVA